MGCSPHHIEPGKQRKPKFILIYRYIPIYPSVIKAQTRPELLDLDALGLAAECLKTLAHPHRLRMIQMLLVDEFTVAKLAAACGIPSHMASDHLGKMKDRGLLTVERRGREAFYQIAEPHLKNIMDCIEARFG